MAVSNQAVHASLAMHECYGKFTNVLQSQRNRLNDDDLERKEKEKKRKGEKRGKKRGGGETRQEQSQIRKEIQKERVKSHMRYEWIEVLRNCKKKMAR